MLLLFAVNAHCYAQSLEDLGVIKMTPKELVKGKKIGQIVDLLKKPTSCVYFVKIQRSEITMVPVSIINRKIIDEYAIMDALKNMVRIHGTGVKNSFYVLTLEPKLKAIVADKLSMIWHFEDD